MPTLVPSSFSSTINDSSATNSHDSRSPRRLSSAVPVEPNRCGVLGYLTKSSREAPMERNPSKIVIREETRDRRTGSDSVGLMLVDQSPRRRRHQTSSQVLANVTTS